jgi:predicted nucleic acid-binding protein
MLASEMPVIYDAVTLHIFSEIGRLDVLTSTLGHRPEPRWTDEVHSEVLKGKNHLESVASSSRILDLAWLGLPRTPVDLPLVFRIQAALATSGRSQDKNLGEAESMVLAIEVGGAFVTDDKAAFDLARRRKDLGSERVHDACAILQLAEQRFIMNADDVKQFHLEIAPKRSMRCRCQY